MEKKNYERGKKLTPQEKWQKNNVMSFTVKLYKNSDNEIISILEKCSNKNGYIRELLKNDAIIIKKYLKN